MASRWHLRFTDKYIITKKRQHKYYFEYMRTGVHMIVNIQIMLLWECDSCGLV